MGHYLEEVFLGCRKMLRIVRVLLIYGEKPLTRYKIEKEAAVYDSLSVLKRLESLGIVEEVEGYHRAYRINRENRFVTILEKFLKECGYL